MGDIAFFLIICSPTSFNLRCSAWKKAVEFFKSYGVPCSVTLYIFYAAKDYTSRGGIAKNRQYFIHIKTIIFKYLGH
jgi:hypothetical protein